VSSSLVVFLFFSVSNSPPEESSSSLLSLLKKEEDLPPGCAANEDVGESLPLLGLFSSSTESFFLNNNFGDRLDVFFAPSMMDFRSNSNRQQRDEMRIRTLLAGRSERYVREMKEKPTRNALRQK
jgi:hypothetical protein